MVQTLQAGINLIFLLRLRLRARPSMAIGEAGKILLVAILVFVAEGSSARGVAGEALLL